jgi:hypothetical protein
MHDIVLLLLLVVAIVILIVSLIYISKASTSIGDTTDPNLLQAYTYLAWTSGILWSLITVVILGSIALVVFGPEFLPLFGKTTVYLALFGMIIAIIVIGVMAAIAASYIGAAANPDLDNIKLAREYSIIAAVVALGSIGIVLIGYFITWHTSKTTVPETQEAQ